MKWIFLSAVLMLFPIVFGLIKSDRSNIVRVCFVLGASILLVGPILWSAPVAWPTWPAPAKGTEVSFIDSIALALFLSTPKVRITPSIKISYVLICLALLISTCVAYNRIAALFYVTNANVGILYLKKLDDGFPKEIIFRSKQVVNRETRKIDSTAAHNCAFAAPSCTCSNCRT